MDSVLNDMISLHGVIDTNLTLLLIDPKSIDYIIVWVTD